MNTVSLIGMPGSGKSTVGVILAKLLRLDFVDTDLLIQLKHGQSLQKILDNEGYLALRAYEEEVILETKLDKRLISTGGSAVYSPKVMAYLKQSSPLVFIHVELSVLLERVNDEATRGIAKASGVSLEAVYDERLPLYQEYADYTVQPEQQLTADTSARHIAGWIGNRAK